ncbi:MAG: type I-E CRISPR-associated protein Cse1/CasA [Pirellulaceae bacterium]
MNVAFEDWIPVVTTAGKRQLASLCDVLAGGDQFADLAVRPHERVALMRLLLCVAHAALDGPKDYDEWCDVPSRLPVAARQYLERWKESFELFHPKKPWLQVATLKGVEKSDGTSGKSSPVAFLDFELATGNSSTLHDHQGMAQCRHIEFSRIALNLLSFQNFSLGGGLPVAQWKETRTKQVGNPDSPCISQSMAHCLLRGNCLADTLHLNLPTFEKLAMAYGVSLEKDGKGGVLGKPVWECFPNSPKDSRRVENATRTYLGRLVPISRWVRLIKGSDQMYCCSGFKYDTYKDGFFAEPTSAVRVVAKTDKRGFRTEERQIVGIRPDKAIWREVPALLVKRSAEGLGGPLAMENADIRREFDFHVCAMIRDQASMDVGVESVFHVFPGFQSNIAAYDEEVRHAEKISQRLWLAIEAYRIEIDGYWRRRVETTPAKDRHKLKNRLTQRASLSYWTAVEKNLSLLIAYVEAIGTDNAPNMRQAWRRMLFASVCDAYRLACGQETPRQIRAFAEGWGRLTNRKRETASKDKEDEA